MSITPPVRRNCDATQLMAPASQPLHRPKNPAKNIHLLPLKPGPVEQAPEAREQALWVVGIEKADFGQRGFHVHEHGVYLALSRQLELWRSEAGCFARSEAQLVGEHLHGAAEIER